MPHSFLFPLFALLLLSAGCTTYQSKSSAAPHDVFFEHYAALTGSAFAGRSVRADLGENNPLNNASLLMIPERHSDDEIRIRFFVNDDPSRTWIIRRTDGSLHLSHDHRYEDGSEYPANLYGGFSDNRGTSTRQFFPADEPTIAARPSRAINIWAKEFDLENQRYYYRLYLDGNLRYEAEFDLTHPIAIPD